MSADDKSVVIILGLLIVVFGVGATLTTFAPDQTAQRIAACMTQPGMEYRYGRGCIRVDG
jgi:hypothetical protein